VHLNFEDERIKTITVDQLHLIGEAHAELFPEFAQDKIWYFLDELQNVKGWEAYARRLVDSPKVQLCLTGSSSKLLSEEIATAMRGRSVPLEVFPLSFGEFLRFNSVLKKPLSAGVYTSAQKGVLRNAMERYFNVGGFPAVQDMPEAARNATLQDYLHAVVYRDVLQRHKVVSVQSLLYTLDYLVHNYARRISVHAISGVLRNLAYPSRREDVADYVSYIKDAYLVYPVSVLSDSLAVKRVNPEKYYVVDTGLVSAVTPKTDAEKGWKLENLVYMALRRGMRKVHYLPLPDNREVDFHVYDQLSGRHSLVQVAWDISDDATFRRELSALREAKAATGIEDCVVVTWDTEADLGDGIRAVPVWQWCLAI
jgi:predicted AAA+ superfamily ATPase